MTDHEKVRRIRVALGFSQKEMAHKLGLENQSVYSKIESGQIKLKMKMKEDLLKLANITQEAFEKMDESPVFSFHQEHGEITGQVVNTTNSDEMMRIIQEITAPYKAHIAELEETNRLLRALLERKN